MKKELQDALERKRAADAEIVPFRKSAIEEIKDLIEIFGIKARELGFSSDSFSSEPDPEPAKQSDAIPMKYKDPVSGKEWSGRGRAPLWIVGNRDEYLIK